MMESLLGPASTSKRHQATHISNPFCVVVVVVVVVAAAVCAFHGAPVGDWPAGAGRFAIGNRWAQKMS